MSSDSKELEKIVDIVSGFFSPPSNSLLDRLKLFQEKGWTGWEKWWQIELATHIANHDYVSDVKIEVPYQKDGRFTSLDQGKLFIDIGFRLKNHSTDWWHYIELKQNANYQRLIDLMLQDARKVAAARKSSNDYGIRHLACFGIYNKEDSDDSSVKQYAKEIAKVSERRIHLFPVGAHHNLIIFSI